jgi:hypothetical protein
MASGAYKLRKNKSIAVFPLWRVVTALVKSDFDYCCCLLLLLGVIYDLVKARALCLDGQVAVVFATSAGTPCSESALGIERPAHACMAQARRDVLLVEIRCIYTREAKRVAR